MSITREQVADLHEGDVVELHSPRYENVSIRGPLHAEGRDLNLAGYPVRYYNGNPGLPEWSLTVISREPRPLYVNHPRTEPVPGDVAKDADGHEPSGHTWHYLGDEDGAHWWRFDDHIRDCQPARLRLLVDGTTGQVVPS